MTSTRLPKLLSASLAALMLTATLASGAQAQDDAATDQRVVRLTAEYAIDPAAGTIDVDSQISVSNVRAATRGSTTITSYFWTAHTVWLPADAENVSIEVDGEPLDYSVERTVQDIDIIVANYNRNLNFGQTQIIDVDYSLPSYPPDELNRRINAALFDFELLICCNFEEVDLTVSIPDSFEVSPPANLVFTPSTSGGRKLFSFVDNENEGQFTEILATEWSGVDDAGLESTTADVGPASIELVYPPDDAQWSEDTAGFIADVGGNLETLTGLPWSAEGTVFRQGPNLDFGTSDDDADLSGTTDLPRSYDEFAFASVLAQGLLADGPFSGEPLQRGLSADLASEALRLTNDTVTSPPSTPPVAGGEFDDGELFWLVRQVSDEIGFDGLSALVGQADRNETAYVGNGDAEQIAEIEDDWRRFLDLAEQRGGSTMVVSLLEDNYLTAEQSAMLEPRADALVDYDRISDKADGVVPLGIRRAMTNWEFGEAESLMATASQILTDRDRVIALAESRGDEPGVELGEAWALADSPADLDAVRASILDRESDINRGGLIRNVLLGVLALIVLASIAGAFFFWLKKKGKAVPAGPSSVATVAASGPGHLASSAGVSGPGSPPFGAPPAGQPGPQGGPSPFGSTPEPGSTTSPQQTQPQSGPPPTPSASPIGSVADAPPPGTPPPGTPAASGAGATSVAPPSPGAPSGPLSPPNPAADGPDTKSPSQTQSVPPPDTPPGPGGDSPDAPPPPT